MEFRRVLFRSEVHVRAHSEKPSYLNRIPRGAKCGRCAAAGQMIGFCRLLQWACGPRSFMKRWGSLRSWSGPPARNVGFPAGAPPFRPLSARVLYPDETGREGHGLFHLLAFDEPYKMRRGGAIAKPRMSLLQRWADHQDRDWWGML